jgi:hypothetical protein
MDPEALWAFLPKGYALTILVEAPILVLGLSRQFSWKERLFAGIWLTTCTYPVVILVLPLALADCPWWLFLLIAETFAPVAECALFWLLYTDRSSLRVRATWRNFAFIALANVASFGVGEVVFNAAEWGLDFGD